MAILSEKKLAHYIEKENEEDTVVIIDQKTGEEVELNKEEFLRLLALVNFSFNLPAFKERLTL